MLAVEIILIAIGVIVIIGSFFVTERLSQQDLDQISMMSEADLKHIAQKQAKDVKREVQTSIEEIIDESLDIAQRGLERETNTKIMAVSEYSDTVLDKINKNHNEIMFLYSMLNDKQSETANMIGDLQRYVKEIRDLDLENTLAKLEEKTKPKTKAKTTTKSKTKKKADENVDLNQQVEAEKTAESGQKVDAELSQNEKILMLYKEGKDEVEIAKSLDCGLGEVRLVLGLYNEA